MSGLPFVVQPRLRSIVERIGNDDIGVLEVERRGYLTAGEKAYLQAYDSKEQTPAMILGLVKKVAKSGKLSLEDAHKAVMASLQGSGATPKQQKLLEPYEDEITGILTAVMASEQNKAVVRASCMLHYRCGLAFEDADQVFTLHPDLTEALSKLCADEEMKSTLRLQEVLSNVDADSEIESLEKKP